MVAFYYHENSITENKAKSLFFSPFFYCAAHKIKEKSLLFKISRFQRISYSVHFIESPWYYGNVISDKRNMALTL